MARELALVRTSGWGERASASALPVSGLTERPRRAAQDAQPGALDGASAPPGLVARAQSYSR